MSSFAGFQDVEISRQAASVLGRGHPWLFGEGVRLAPGTPVVLWCEGRRVGFGLADEGSVSVRVLGRGAPRPIGALIAERIARADAARTRLVPADTDGYRVVSGAGDALTDLVVDRYADLAVLRVYARAWEPYLQDVTNALARLPWTRTVLRRLGVKRVDSGPGTQVLSGPRPADVLTYRERGMRLLVRPHVGQKTGMFLDQRENRQRVRELASGASVLNLFSYTGGFSVAAALGGARHVTTVDVAADAIEDAKENFRLNGLDPDRHAFEVADIFEWVPSGAADLIVLDPPSLAKNKTSEKPAFAAYRKLHRRFGRHVEQGGLLGTSSCTAWLSLSRWREAVEAGLCDSGAWSWVGCSVEPADHPVALAHGEAHYLKFAWLRRLEDA